MQLSVKYEAAQKGRKIAAFMAILCRVHVIFFAVCRYIWHCGDNTIMNDMIYGKHREHFNTAQADAEGHAHMQNDTVANYFIEIEMNDLITHDSLCSVCVCFLFFISFDAICNDQIRMRAVHDIK